MKNVIVIKSTRPPVVEIDEQAWAVYVRFNKGTVAKTVELPSPQGLVTVDFDRTEKVLGVELIGVREFTISALLKRVPRIQVPNAVLAKARYISAAGARAEAKIPNAVLARARYINAAGARAEAKNEDLVPV
jgi:hypothetical protein